MDDELRHDIHRDLINILSDFIIKHGRKYLYQKNLTNNWASGMMKSACLINEYFSKQEKEKEKETTK